MSEDKRFALMGKGIGGHHKKELHDFSTLDGLISVTKCMNELHEETEELKKELQIYRKLASCSNCKYHDYDTLFGDDEEYEVCNKGNDVTYGICKDWRKF